MWCPWLPLYPNLGKYLGFTLKHVGSSSQDYSSIIERVHVKLAGWKANLLSFAGRVVLSQATISAIPSYISSFSQVEMETFPWKRVPWTLLWYMVCNKKKRAILSFPNAPDGKLGVTLSAEIMEWQVVFSWFCEKPHWRSFDIDEEKLLVKDVISNGVLEPPLHLSFVISS